MTFEERDGFVVARIVRASAEDVMCHHRGCDDEFLRPGLQMRMVGVIMTGMGSDGHRGHQAGQGS
jgi:chemotaxis response regulator CheB